MKVLVTGANGFLGQYLVERSLHAGYKVIATGKGRSRLALEDPGIIYEPMDLTDPYAIHDVFEKYAPEIVVHAGAMARPDDCEQNQSLAYAINVEATVQLLLNAEVHKSHFIFVSTDFVFDGEKGMYSESDQPHPVNYYGRTKLEAEEAVMEYRYDWAIARTVLVYGRPLSPRPNFLGIVKEKLDKQEPWSIVDDQQRTPTYVDDLAKGIVSIIIKKAKGIYHISGKDLLTPYEMACLTADFFNLDRSIFTKVTSDNFSQPARRPLKTGFIIEKARKELEYEPVSFEEGLIRTFKGL